LIADHDTGLETGISYLGEGADYYGVQLGEGVGKQQKGSNM